MRYILPNKLCLRTGLFFLKYNTPWFSSVFVFPILGNLIRFLFYKIECTSCRIFLKEKKIWNSFQLLNESYVMYQVYCTYGIVKLIGPSLLFKSKLRTVYTFLGIIYGNLLIMMNSWKISKYFVCHKIKHHSTLPNI